MDDNHFHLWATQLRRDSTMWNKGFRWGVASGAGIVVLGTILFGWFISP